MYPKHFIQRCWKRMRSYPISVLFPLGSFHCTNASYRNESHWMFSVDWIIFDRHFIEDARFAPGQRCLEQKMFVYFPWFFGRLSRREGFFWNWLRMHFTAVTQQISRPICLGNGIIQLAVPVSVDLTCYIVSVEFGAPRKELNTTSMYVLVTNVVRRSEAAPWPFCTCKFLSPLFCPMHCVFPLLNKAWYIFASCNWFPNLPILAFRSQIGTLWPT